MAKKSVGIIMNGVTGRMGTNQHLVRSILAIREQGGVALPDGTVLWPEPVLVGRDEAKLRALAEAHGLSRVSTDLDACLADPANSIYFDAQTTSRRAPALRAAIGPENMCIAKSRWRIRWMRRSRWRSSQRSAACDMEWCRINYFCRASES